MTTADTHDDGLEWLREIRRKITTDFGHDQKKIGGYLCERESDGRPCRPHAESPFPTKH